MSERTSTTQVAPGLAGPDPQGRLLQRRCACGTHTAAGGECEACRRSRGWLQRSARDTTEARGWPSSVEQALRTPGRPLPAEVRGFMELRFQHDFSRVRVHDDALAAQSASATRALAYTVGHDIVFGSGQYAPDSTRGRRLLAHELAHTIQQVSAPGAVQMRGEIDAPDSPLEREADSAADSVLSNRVPTVIGRAGALRPQLEGDPARLTRRRQTADGYVDVTRIVEEKPCTQTPETQKTKPGDMLYFDNDAGAFGIRYSLCRGSTQVELESQARYDRLRSDAEQLLRRLPQAVSAGGDVLSQIRQAAQQTSVGARTTVAVTVSGILRVELRGSTDQGLQSHSYEVAGMLRLTPNGWALQLDASYRNVVDQLSGTVETVSFTPRVNVGPVQAGVTVEHQESRPSSGTPTSTTTVRGRVSVATGRGLGFSLSGSSESGGTFSVTFGTVDQSQTVPQVPTVECVTRDCPPSTVRFECNRVHAAHTEDVEVQSAGHQVVQLHYVLDQTTPADTEQYGRRVDQVVDLMRNHYAVQSIEGFASPEASRAYNQGLSERRARQARSDIETRLAAPDAPPASALPVPHGQGELLGARAAGSGESWNERLIADIGARLDALPEAQQFELFGIDPSTLDDAGRADLRARISEFRQGGRGMTLRARWERVFPFLRRVDVTLDRPRLTQPTPVAERREPSASCDTDSINWANQNMPPLPPDKRLPQQQRFGF